MQVELCLYLLIYLALCRQEIWRNAHTHYCHLIEEPRKICTNLPEKKERKKNAISEIFVGKRFGDKIQSRNQRSELQRWVCH